MTACFPAMWPIFDDIWEYADHFFSQTDSGETVDIVVDEKGDEPAEFPKTEPSAQADSPAGKEKSFELALAEGSYVRWIDRFAELPPYAKEFYSWLEGEADKGADSALAAARGESVGSSSEQMHYVTTFTGTIDFTFATKAAAEEIKSTATKAAEEACASMIQENYDASFACLLAAYHAFDRDHPEVFWLNGGAMIGNKIEYSISYRTSGTGTVEYRQKIYFYLQIPSENFDIRDSKYSDTSAIRIGIAAREAAIANILNGYEGSGTRYDKVKYLNRWLTGNNGYNTDLEHLPDNDPWKCISALRGSNGNSGPVCEGYARAFKVLCDRWEIPCVLVDGQAFSGDSASGEEHMWNYIQMEDGRWYGVDVTWNDPVVKDFLGNKKQETLSGCESEKWLLLGSETVVDDGLTFVESHPVSNQIASIGMFLNNGPVLAENAYEKVQ